jgi:hypothetical protein
VQKLSDFQTFASELILPVGTEFDVIGFVIGFQEAVLYVADGTPTIAAIECRASGDVPKTYASLVIIENVRFQNFDRKVNVVHLAALNSTSFSRNASNSQKSQANGLLRFRDTFYLENFVKRLELMRMGGAAAAFEAVNISHFSFLTKTEIVASICDFESIDFHYKSNSISVVVFGSIFADAAWKTKFIESRKEFDIGLNMIFQVTDGLSTRILTVPSHQVDNLFNAIGRAASPQSAAIVGEFFGRFLDEGCDGLQMQRAQIRGRFMLDALDVAMMLRQAFWHCELVYDEAETVERMKGKRLQLAFPFRPEEWWEFVRMLRRVLPAIELGFDLFDDGKIETERISVVSDVVPVDTSAACRHLMSLL